MNSKNDVVSKEFENATKLLSYLGMNIPSHYGITTVILTAVYDYTLKDSKKKKNSRLLHGYLFETHDLRNRWNGYWKWRWRQV